MASDTDMKKSVVRPGEWLDRLEEMLSKTPQPHAICYVCAVAISAMSFVAGAWWGGSRARR